MKRRDFLKLTGAVAVASPTLKVLSEVAAASPTLKVLSKPEPESNEGMANVTVYWNHNGICDILHVGENNVARSETLGVDEVEFRTGIKLVNGACIVIGDKL